MIDFKKPIRFVCDKEPAHFVGPLLDGNFVIERTDFIKAPLILVDENGCAVINSSISSFSPVIENVPERITRWILMTPHMGYDSKEDALEVAKHCWGEEYTVVKIEFEEGERS